jgi:UDP-N-acetylmuramoylalanine--D-glutamate ligase
MSLPIPPFLRPLFARPVAILGGGIVGRGLHALLARINAADSFIYDPDPAQGIEFTPAAAAGHALVVFSPEFAPDHPWLRNARAAGCECMGELDFAALFWRGQIVAVTGNHGRTLLAEFLTHGLRSNGFAARRSSPQRYPLSQLVAERGGGSLAVAEEIAVCEVSSAQAGTLRHLRVDATLWTDVAGESDTFLVERSADFSAKWTLVACTAPGGFFAGSSVQVNAARFGRPFPVQAAVATAQPSADSRLADSIFANGPQRESFMLAAAWWHAVGLSADDLYAAARTFRPDSGRRNDTGDVKPELLEVAGSGAGLAPC